MSVKRNNYLELGLYFVFFVLFSIIMFFSPHTVDDTFYDHLNLSNFFDILHFSAGYGNGRVFGNMLGIYLCKTRIGASIIRSLMVSLLIFFIDRILILLCNGKRMFVIISLLILTVGSKIFGQAYSWISAFSNYFSPVLITAICVYLILKHFNEEKINKILLIFVFVIGCAGQLFSENSSLNSFLIAIMLLIFCIKEKKNLYLSLAYFLSTGLGAFIMIILRQFCKDDRSPYYSVDSYHQNLNGIKDLIYRIVLNTARYLKWFSQCKGLLFVIAIVGIIIILNSNMNLLKKIISTIGLCTYPAFCMLYSWSNNFKNENAVLYYAAVSAVLFFLYFISLIIIGLSFDKKIRFTYFGIFVYSIVISAYLLILSPISSRCFFYTYCCLVVLTIFMIKQIKHIEYSMFKCLEIGVIGIIAVYFIYLIPLYININSMNNKVNSYIEYQVKNGNKTVEICNLTNTDYFHHSIASSRLGYTYYIEKAMDVEFVIIDQSEWLTKYDEQYLE